MGDIEYYRTLCDRQSTALTKNQEAYRALDAEIAALKESHAGLCAQVERLLPVVYERDKLLLQIEECRKLFHRWAQSEIEDHAFAALMGQLLPKSPITEKPKCDACGCNITDLHGPTCNVCKRSREKPKSEVPEVECECASHCTITRRQERERCAKIVEEYRGDHIVADMIRADVKKRKDEVDRCARPGCGKSRDAHLNLGIDYITCGYFLETLACEHSWVPPADTHLHLPLVCRKCGKTSL